MLQTKEYIQRDLEAIYECWSQFKDKKKATQKIGFLNNCMNVLEQFTEDYIYKNQIEHIRIVKIYRTRRKEDKTIYKEELKEALKYKKWLKYLIIRNPYLAKTPRKSRVKQDKSTLPRKKELTLN